MDHTLRSLAVAAVLLVQTSAALAWDVADVVWFGLGVVVPIVAHEAGHELKGGDSVDWEGTEWACNRPCNGSAIAAAGFYSEIAVTEILARTFDAPEDRAFRLGMRLSAGAHMLLRASGQNPDFDNFEGSRRHRMRTLVGAAAVFNLLQFSMEF